MTFFLIRLDLLEGTFPDFTQESQLVVVHHELDAVDLQRFGILYPDTRGKGVSNLPFTRAPAGAAPSSPC